MAVGLRPLGDRVVVKPLARDEMTKSGIVLPDTAKEKPQQGEVLAVGPGRTLDNGEKVAVELKTGDTVSFSGLQKALAVSRARGDWFSIGSSVSTSSSRDGAACPAARG